MKLFVVLASVIALSSALDVSAQYGELAGNIVNNELLRTTRGIFNSGSGGWGGASGPSSSLTYKPGPPPLESNGFVSLFNAMSNFGKSSTQYGPPSPPSSQYGPPSPPSSQYGPPPPAGGSKPPTQYGPPPPAGGSSPSGPSRPPSSQYGPPQNAPAAGIVSNGPVPVVSTRNRGYTNNAGGRTQGGAPAQSSDGGRIFRYVSLFTAPDEPAPTRPKVIRAGPSTPDKHVNIIFVKPPSPPEEQPTEVLLAPEPERKTIVYVLMKKPVENPDAVRIRAPAPTQPAKPEVFFIPYKDGQGPAGQGPNNPGGYESPNGDLGAPGQGPSGGYDAPSGPAPGGNPGGYA